MEDIERRLKDIDTNLFRIKNEIGKLKESLPIDLLGEKVLRIEWLLLEIQREIFENDKLPPEGAGEEQKLSQECIERGANIPIVKLEEMSPPPMEDEEEYLGDVPTPDPLELEAPEVGESTKRSKRRRKRAKRYNPDDSDPDFQMESDEEAQISSDSDSDEKPDLIDPDPQIEPLNFETQTQDQPRKIGRPRKHPKPIPGVKKVHGAKGKKKPWAPRRKRPPKPAGWLSSRQRESDKNKVQCPQCPVKIPAYAKIQFEFHKLSHRVSGLEESFQRGVCPVCQHQSKGGDKNTKHRLTGLKKHILGHFNVNFFRHECGQCGKQFANKSGLKTHEVTHQTGDHICEICGHISINPTSLRHHRNRLHSQFKCPKCPQTCAKQETLDRHIKDHEILCVCELCGQSMPKVDLISHKYQKHPLFKCTIDGCLEELSSKDLLQEHRIANHQAKFMCDLCGHGSFTQNEAASHLRRSHERTLKCGFEGCDAEFKLKKQWEYHVNGHKRVIRESQTQEELKNSSGPTYPCDICGKIYAHAPSLYHHKKNFHVEIRTFPCEVCGKAFKNVHVLNTHVLSHENRVECQFCKGVFSKANLAKHIQVRHAAKSGTPYTCQVEGCDKGYYRKKNLESHMQKAHPDS